MKFSGLIAHEMEENGYIQRVMLDSFCKNELVILIISSNPACNLDADYYITGSCFSHIRRMHSAK